MDKKELRAIPYSELRNGFYWGRIEDRGKWYIWSIFHIDIVLGKVEIRNMWSPGMFVQVFDIDYVPTNQTGIFLYKRTEPPGP